MAETPGAPDDISLCAECHTRLAHDQRYCVECGTRRGALPAGVAAMIGAIHERGSRAARPRRPAPKTAPGPSWVPALTMPTPRAAAAGVLAMLAFGVLVGSFGGAGLQSLASSQLLVAVSRPAGQNASTPPPDTGNTGSSGGGGTTTIITRTVVGAAPATTGQTGAATPSAPTTSTTTPGGSTTPPQNLFGLPPIHHVFLIVLSDQGFSQTFAPTSPDQYFSKELAKQGELITNYYAVAGSPLANRIALISGQGPTPETTQNCPVYAAIKPGTVKAGQVNGTGCVYPAATQTIAEQLTAAHKTWKAYVEGTDAASNGQQTSCRHPTLGVTDPEHAPRGVKDPYVTWSNPFVYFTTLTSGTDCLDNDVGLGALQYDVKTGSQAPTVSFIFPNACHDGSDVPCGPNAPSGLAPADAFVRSTVTEIEKSSAYKDNGLIVVTFDEAAQTGPHADPSGCCNTPAYPNMPPPPPVTTSTGSTTATPGTTPTSTQTSTTATTSGTGTTTTTSTTTSTTPPASSTGQTTPTGGGGQVGLLLISRYNKPGTQDLVDFYNHYSLLATLENLFALKRLGYAGNLELPVFDAAVFNAPH